MAGAFGLVVPSGSFALSILSSSSPSPPVVSLPPTGGEISALPQGFPSLSWRTSVSGKLSRPYASSFHFSQKASSKDDLSTFEATYSDAKYAEPDTRSQLIFAPDSLELKIEDATESSNVKEKKSTKRAAAAAASRSLKVDITEVIKYPVRTEAAQKEMVERNTLVFMVDKRSDKIEIKEAMKKLLGVSIKRVNTLMTPEGKKKAFIALSPEYNAADVAKKVRIY